jgi:hypothetical protein
MEFIPRKPLRAICQCSLALLGLMCLLGTADARPMLPPERFPGPWLEVTQEIRKVLALNKVSACSQAAGRESSSNPGEYLLYCTSDERLWTSWRVQPAARTVRGPGWLFESIPLPRVLSPIRRLLCERGCTMRAFGNALSCANLPSSSQPINGFRLAASAGIQH